MNIWKKLKIARKRILELKLEREKLRKEIEVQKNMIRVLDNKLQREKSITARFQKPCEVAAEIHTPHEFIHLQDKILWILQQVEKNK